MMLLNISEVVEALSRHKAIDDVSDSILFLKKLQSKLEDLESDIDDKIEGIVEEIRYEIADSIGDHKLELNSSLTEI